MRQCNRNHQDHRCSDQQSIVVGSIGDHGHESMKDDAVADLLLEIEDIKGEIMQNNL